MNNLTAVLDKMLDVLTSLNAVMDEEQQQLSVGHINSRLLQRITEDKSSLLSTLNYLDELRRQMEKQNGLQAPYHSHPVLTRSWQLIQQRTQTLRDTNTHNGLLLNQQMHFNQQALAILKPHHSQSFYGPDGQTTPDVAVSRKI
ncbi:Flagellar biosynthesis protein FlgN [Paramixta manurensis]|uniref:Flagellar biosynthesis protein FlgN n=1 Tax=Paramixta manurensis TaxID=2740817 RepID=A0A6M8UN67_9GAMM|nr:Flagellar biosynthesis protein FlgN [Erwiniaceae bacterium PD-1]